MPVYVYVCSDQIIYPHSRAEMDELGVSDDDLTRLLDIVDPARSICNGERDFKQ